MASLSSDYQAIAIEFARRLGDIAWKPSPDPEYDDAVEIETRVSEICEFQAELTGFFALAFLEHKATEIDLQEVVDLMFEMALRRRRPALESYASDAERVATVSALLSTAAGNARRA